MNIAEAFRKGADVMRWQCAELARENGATVVAELIEALTLPEYMEPVPPPPPPPPVPGESK